MIRKANPYKNYYLDNNDVYTVFLLELYLLFTQRKGLNDYKMFIELKKATKEN